jgi:hypothetical protein
MKGDLVVKKLRRKTLKLERLLKEIKKGELVQLTQDLIRIPSVRRQEQGEQKVALYLTRLLEGIGLDVVVESMWSPVLQMSSPCFRVKVKVHA